MSIKQRKADHLELCTDGDVGFASKTTLLEEVELLHEALPELALDEIDTATELLGKPLCAPLVIAAMTGGTERAVAINRELASIAEEHGYGFGLGSQRPMLENPADPSYRVRAVAPSCLLLGNLAAVQARQMGLDRVAELATLVGADAMCLHLDAAMEIVQPGGDRDFRGLLDTIAKASRALPIPVLAKETGCGIGPATARRLAQAGVRHVDVSGAGGTSWVAVERLRAEAEGRRLGDTFREWGVPTAAAVAYAHAARPAFATIIATGGVRSGLDVARAIALGAHAAGLARPVLQAYRRGGRSEVERLLAAVVAELGTAMLLVGARTLGDLRAAPRLLGPRLGAWLGLGRARRVSRAGRGARGGRGRT